MATKPAQPPVSPPPPDASFDELTGVYGFFRRHQKKLLYTAGLFTLLTFSISGPMIASVGELFGHVAPMPTIVVGGARVSMESEDFKFGEAIARSNGATLPPVLPNLSAGEGGQTQLSEVIAMLRRAAVVERIDVSMVEVDRAIEAWRDHNKMQSAARMAQQWNFGSLANYREVVREAMRVGTYVWLQTLALDTSDARVMQQVTNEREKITLRVASFDEKALEEQLVAASTLTDDDLRKWLDGKSDQEKTRIQAFDLPRAELRLGALLLAAGEFDPEQWKEDALKDFSVGDDQLNSEYEREKDPRFKAEAAGEFKPFEDPAVKAELTRLMQAEQVMRHVLGKVREKHIEAMKPANDELAVTQTERAQAESHVNDLNKQIADKPDDADLKEKLRLAEEILVAKKTAVTAQETALKDARIAFDFPAVFAELTQGKKGCVQKATVGLKNGDELKDLDAGDVGLGQWPQAAFGTRMQNKGDLGFQPGRTSKAVVIYQATDVEPRPLKAWDTLKPLVQGAYWSEQAKTQAEAKRKLMEEAILRLAKEKMPEKVTEIEGKRPGRIDEKFGEWRSKTEASIAEAEKHLAKPNLGSQAKTAWQQMLDGHKAQLAAAETRRKDIETEIQKLIDAEIAEEAKKHYKDVLDAAAAEAGATVRDLPPFQRDLQRVPRFDKAYDPTVVFLFRSHSELKEGETTGLVDDKTNRRWHVAVCTKVEPLSADDVTRRNFEMMRTGNGMFSFADMQALIAFQQAFTLAALEKRYEYLPATGQQKEPKPDEKASK